MDHSHIRTAVKREGAEQYLLLMLVSFAFSVILTRLFLMATGYPKIGNGELHIAHVLWGGLLLFIASILPITFANRWAMQAGAILSGVGVGLFIDEVGKFITQSNDYFYPAAAPIIYAFFLLTVLLYVQVRRPAYRDPRDELYRVLDLITEVLDKDLDEQERNVINSRLKYISGSTTDPNLQRFTKEMTDFIEAEALLIAPKRLGFFQRLYNRLREWEIRYLRRSWLRVFIVISLALTGGFSIYRFVHLVVSWLGQENGIFQFLSTMALSVRLHSPTEIRMFLIQLTLDFCIGLIALCAVALILLGKERPGAAIGSFAMIFSLTTATLLVFYLTQFSALLTAVTQFVVLVAINYYRRKFIPS